MCIGTHECVQNCFQLFKPIRPHACMSIKVHVPMNLYFITNKIQIVLDLKLCPGYFHLRGYIEYEVCMQGSFGGSLWRNAATAIVEMPFGRLQPDRDIKGINITLQNPEIATKTSTTVGKHRRDTISWSTSTLIGDIYGCLIEVSLEW